MRKAFSYTLLLGYLIGIGLFSAQKTHAHILDRTPSSMDRATRALANSSNAFEQGKILPPDVIMAYKKAQELQLQEKYIDPVVSDAESFRGKDTQQASKLVADRYLKYWWQESETKNSPVTGQIIEIENSMNKQVIVRQGSIQHHFDFSVEAFAAQAKLEYVGFFNASVSYLAQDSASSFEIKVKVWNQKDLILSTTQDPKEYRNAIHLQWNF